MKPKFFITIIGLIFLSSCISSYYYQIYKVTPLDKLVLKDNSITYEDSNCIIYYNFWNQNGNIGFRFYNKTNKNLFLNLDECFFISNGIAYNYYLNRVFTKNFNAISYSKYPYYNPNMGSNISYVEEKIVCIPATTSKIISEYSINEIPYRHCDIFRFPSEKEIKTITFTKEKSPLMFSNRIVYTNGNSPEKIEINNEFYISEITNYPESEVIERKMDIYCGNRENNIIEIFKIISPNKFYIKYNSMTATWIKL